MGIKTKIYKILHPNCLSSEERVERLKKKGFKIGENVHIYSDFGEEKYFSLIEIGNCVSISQKVSILVHDASPKKEIGYTKINRVKIGNNVFIGLGCIILPGTIIEDNCIIGAGSVVRGTIPTNSVVAGNPAKVICSYDDYISKNKAKFDERLIFDDRSYDDMVRAGQMLKDNQTGYVL